jgi:AcrR family transcriptional regulator
MATNHERSTKTRQSLIAEARQLFAKQGYAATGTESILKATGMKRGALYHHFADKSVLFEAVYRQIYQEATQAIELALPKERQLFADQDVVHASMAWLRFVSKPEIRQIMLIDAPAALGSARWLALEKELGAASLHKSIEAAAATGMLQPGCSAEQLTNLVKGALSALALSAGLTQDDTFEAQHQEAVEALWRGFLRA